MTRIIDLYRVIDWINRFGPLLEFLDQETTGYGTVIVQMHGKRAVKAGKVGRMQTLQMWGDDFEIRS